MIQIFRASIILSSLSYILFIALPYLEQSFLSQQEIDALSWVGYEAVISMPNWLHWLTVFIWLPLAIGMWFLNPLARTAYLYLSIFFLILHPFTGLFVETGWGVMLFQATAFLDGAILTMAYFTGLNKEFKNA